MTTCRLCGEPITLVMRVATATTTRDNEIWIHTERQGWHGNYYDHDAHNAEPTR